MAHQLLQVMLAAPDVELGLHDLVPAVEDVALHAQLAPALGAALVQRKLVVSLLAVDLRQQEVADVGHLLELGPPRLLDEERRLVAGRLQVVPRHVQLGGNPVLEEVRNLGVVGGPLAGARGGLGLREGGAFGIIFSLVCIGLAAMSLVLDFDIIEQGIKHGADEKFAWYASFSLMVTLVWLYLEILRLLGYLRD